jgi:hypothetical protein
MLSTPRFTESTLSIVNSLHYNDIAFENSDLTSPTADRAQGKKHQ